MRVCVVDDEIAVRAGIINKLNSLQKNIEVFDVKFGYMALEKIKLIQPDLVIADIMMPELDGLELLRHIKETVPSVKVVLLSGYSQFEYARKALQLGAANYLLKPLNRNDLLELINEVEGELKSRMRSELAIYSNQLSFYQVEMDQVECQSPSLWFNETVPKRFVFADQAETSGYGQEQPERVITSFSLKKRTSGSIVLCSVNDPDHFFQRGQFIPAFLRSLEKWETERFFGGLFNGKAISETESDALLKRAKELRKSIMKAIKSKDQQTVEQQLPVYLKSIARLALKRLRKECTMLMSSIDEVLTRKEDIDLADEENRMYWHSWVEQYDSWELLKKDIARFVIGGIKAVIQPDQNEISNIVERAIRFVSDHNKRNVSLVTVADQLDIHPVTLSRIFKKIKGENFVHFITRHKIIQAERLLMETDKKVSVICEEVGYTDQRYFSLLFKKSTGHTPSEYRKSHNHRPHND